MRETMEQGIFWQFAAWVYRRRKAVAVFWLVMVLGLALFAQKAPELMKDNGFTPKGSESDQGIVTMQQKLGTPPSIVTLAFESDTLDLTTPEQTKRILDSLQPLKELPYVADEELNTAARTQTAGGNRIQSVILSLKLNTDEALERFPELRSKIKAPDGMRVYVTGGAPILYDMQEASKHDIAKAELIGLPIALLVLLVVFGTLIGALLPLIVGGVSVTVTLGIAYFLAHGMALSNFLPNMVTMLGLAVGIDYALFMVSRFREELKRTNDVAESVARTGQTAGRSIFFSGVAVLIGLLGMLFINLTFFRSLCLGGVLVVSVSVLVANTLLPALLGLFGHRINALRVLPRRFRGGGGSRVWERIAYGVMRHPVLLVSVVSLLLLALMLPMTRMDLGVPSAGVLPPSYESRYGADLLDRAFDAREAFPVQLVVETSGDLWSESSIQELQQLEARVKQTAGVKDVRSLLTPFAGKPANQIAAALKDPALRAKLQMQHLAGDHAALLIAVPQKNPTDSETNGLVRDLRSLDPGSFKLWITGDSAYRVDILDRINSRLPEVVGFVMLITYFVLLLAFRSVLLPLKAVLMNVLSLGASLGIVVEVFQYGYGAKALHITSTGYVSATLPVIIFCVVFGISMDYEVFLLSRVAEEYQASGDNERSTAQGLIRTGSLITSAAFILVVVVGSFIFTDIEIIKALGLGLGLAVLIDATVVRVALVPALMKLLGAANWWAPRWLRPAKPPGGDGKVR